MRTSPAAGGRMPTIVSSSVVFPAPLPPTIATTSPGATEKEMSCSVVRPCVIWVTSCASTAATLARRLPATLAVVGSAAVRMTSLREDEDRCPDAPPTTGRKLGGSEENRGRSRPKSSLSSAFDNPRTVS